MIKELLKNPTDNMFIQLFRYTIVGGASFAVDFGVLFVLTEYFRVYYLVSAIWGFLLGLTTNYLLSILWVFTRHTLRSRWHEFGVFGLIGIIGLGLNEFFIWSFTEFIHFHYLISKVISTTFVYLWNFFTRKFILFR